MKDFDVAYINEQGKLISTAINIVKELSENKLADDDSDNYNSEETENVKGSIIKARSLMLSLKDYDLL
jgi:hypothetical protein